jgi:hypothetical protein
MVEVSPLDTVFATGAFLGALTTYIYVSTGLAYRHRDNGLAYLLFVLGVGIWNGMFAAQFLGSAPMVDQFFFSLSMVGALLASLGWFLFASTASSTPDIPAQRLVYGAAAVTVGLAITMLVTAPVHSFYWTMDATPSLLADFTPKVGYWVHTGLLMGLFGAGGVLFAAAWHRGERLTYTRAYVTVGGATVAALLGSHVLTPGGMTVAPLVAVGLTTVGWLQAKRWTPSFSLTESGRSSPDRSDPK